MSVVIDFKIKLFSQRYFDFMLKKQSTCMSFYVNCLVCWSEIKYIDILYVEDVIINEKYGLMVQILIVQTLKI